LATKVPPKALSRGLIRIDMAIDGLLANAPLDPRLLVTPLFMRACDHLIPVFEVDLSGITGAQGALFYLIGRLVWDDIL
jgi:hypothetical protein